MAAAVMRVTPAGAGDNSGDSWANAMALSDWLTDASTAAEAGDVYYILGGTYTLTGNIDFYSRPGSSAEPISVIGVKSTTTNEDPVYSDWAFGDDRPLLVLGAYSARTSNYYIVRNLRFTTTHADGFKSYSGYIENLKSYNSSTTAGRSGLTMASGSNGMVIGCEGISTKGNGIIIGGVACALLNSYVHDSNKGVYLNTNAERTVVAGTAVDTCVIGIDLDDPGIKLFGNSIVNCTTGIVGDAQVGIIGINNLLDGNILGASWSSELNENYWNFNIWNNTTDVSNITQGQNAITDDPDITSVLVTGSDGTTEAGDETDFRSASAPFDGVTTDDVLIIHSGTSVTAGVYTITSVDSTSKLTISAGATVGASSCVFGILKGSDFSLGTGSPALNAGLMYNTWTSAT